MPHRINCDAAFLLHRKAVAWQTVLQTIELADEVSNVGAPSSFAEPDLGHYKIRFNPPKLETDMPTLLNRFTLIAFASLAVFMGGCGLQQANHSNSHENSKHSSKAEEGERTRPTNQVAVLTVWAEVDKFERTVKFYKETLGLRDVGSGPKQHIYDTDGSFLIIMEGKLEHPLNVSKRWPLFALTVPDLNESIKSLKDSKTELPWGIEEFGEPNPSSRYVMFYDPAGNLIELVEWL